MATRFYLPSSGTPPLSTLARSGQWERPSGSSDPSVARFPTYTTKQDSALTTGGATWNTTTTSDWCLWQFQSEELTAGYTFTSADTFTSAIGKCLESLATTDSVLRIVVRAVSSDGSTVHGTLFDNTGTVEFPTTTAESRLVSASSLQSSLALSIGDRIIIELGARGTTPSLSAFEMRIGDPTATSDFAFTSGLTTDLCGWFEFSADLQFGAIDVQLVGDVTQTKHTVSGTLTITDVDVRLTGATTQTKHTVTGTLTFPDVFFHEGTTQTKHTVTGTLTFVDVDVRITGATTQTKHTVIGGMSVDFTLLYGSSVQRKQVVDGILFCPITGEVAEPLSAISNYELLLDNVEYPLIRARIERHRNYEKAVADIPSALTQIVIASAPTTLEIVMFRNILDGSGIQQVTLFTGTLDLAETSQNIETGQLRANGLASYPTRANRLLQGSPSYVRDSAESTSVRGMIDPLLVPGDVLRFAGVREIGVSKIVYSIDTNYQFMEAVSGL